MKIIITGGSGLIGSALAKDLSENGYEVIVLSRSPLAVQEKLTPGVRCLGWDGQTSQGWGDLASGAKAIVNLAGANISGGRWTPARKRLILQSRLQAGQAVTQAFQTASPKPEALVQASAVGYYGPHGDEPVTEETAKGQDFLAHVCAEWEASTAGVEQAGVRRVIIRTGVALAKQGGAFPLMALPYRLYIGGPIGSGKQWLPWISLKDEVGAIRFLIEDSMASGIYNFSSPNPTTNKSFGQVLGEVLRRPSYLPVPAFFLKLLFGEMATILLDGQRQIPERLVRQGYVFRFPDLELAIRDIFS